MSGPASRRGFLRDLVGLPLVGGGLTLIGAPTAVAAPCTEALFDRYLAFVVHEHREVLVEHSRRKAMRHADEWQRKRGLPMPPGFIEACAQDTRECPYLFWAPKGSDDIRTFVESVSPTTRAALVLSAVGCGWEARS